MSDTCFPSGRLASETETSCPLVTGAENARRCAHAQSQAMVSIAMHMEDAASTKRKRRQGDTPSRYSAAVQSPEDKNTTCRGSSDWTCWPATAKSSERERLMRGEGGAGGREREREREKEVPVKISAH